MRAVNLIPAEQRAGGGPVAGESQGAAFLVLGLLAGLALLAGLYGMAAHQVSSRQGEEASIAAQAQATQARANALAPYTNFKSMYQQRQAAVNQLVNTRFDWAHAFHEIGRVLPADASLSSVKGTIGSTTAVGAATATPSKTASAAVASATPPGTIPTFVLAGCATSQSETAQTIQRLRLIDGVSSVTLQSSSKSSSGGGSTGTGGCPPGDPAFAITVTFAALPSPPAASKALPGASTQPAASGGTGSTSSPSPATAPASGTKGAQ